MSARTCEVVIDVEEDSEGHPGTLVRCAATAAYVLAGRGVCQEHRLEVGLRDDFTGDPTRA